MGNAQGFAQEHMGNHRRLQPTVLTGVTVAFL